MFSADGTASAPSLGLLAAAVHMPCEFYEHPVELGASPPLPRERPARLRCGCWGFWRCVAHSRAALPSSAGGNLYEKDRPAAKPPSSLIARSATSSSSPQAAPSGRGARGAATPASLGAAEAVLAQTGKAGRREVNLLASLIGAGAAAKPVAAFKLSLFQEDRPEGEDDAFVEAALGRAAQPRGPELGTVSIDLAGAGAGGGQGAELAGILSGFDGLSTAPDAAREEDDDLLDLLDSVS